MVPRRRLELPQPYGYWHLKPARLPIPPPGPSIVLNIIKISMVNAFDTFIVNSDYLDGFQLQNDLFNWQTREVVSLIINLRLYSGRVWQ